jgi:glycosyltransferase involved in cell wall biosynthesis
MRVPAVSVIIPTYNRAAFLSEALASVLAQTMGDLEVLVVDDGSTDATREIVMSFDDPRVRYLFQKNLGVSAARNWGVASSRAPLIAFLDSDDVWQPTKLDVQAAYFTAHPEISICQTEEIWVRDGKRVNPCDKHAKQSGWIFRECIPLCIVSPSAVMLRREAFYALGGFDESLPACEDYDLWLRAALRYEIHTLPNPLIVKRGGHDDQLSKGWGLDRYRILALQKILGDDRLLDEDRELVKADIARRAAIVADGARKRENEVLVHQYEAIVWAYLHH